MMPTESLDVSLASTPSAFLRMIRPGRTISLPLAFATLLVFWLTGLTSPVHAGAKVLSTFSTPPSEPKALTAAADGSFYGVSRFGGMNGNGTIFKVAADGTFTLLHSFAALDGPEGENEDGRSPLGPLVFGNDGLLYGVTREGGEWGRGTLFRITTAGDFTTLYHFGAGLDVSPSTSLLRASDGNFYGAGSRIFYRLSADGVVTILATKLGFARPEGALVEGADGAIYGVGASASDLGSGVVFKFTTAGKVSTLYTFPAVQNSNGPGLYPQGLVLDATGNLYGQTFLGGANGTGTIYKLSPQGRLTVLHSFASDVDWYAGFFTDGTIDQRLVFGADGNLYGTIPEDDTHGAGFVFRLTPSGSFGELATLDNAAIGSYPYSGLIVGNDGAFYGTAGGGYYDASAFRVALNGQISRVASLGTNAGGFNPTGLARSAFDNQIYGSTKGGGAHGTGTIFRVDETGARTVIYDFPVTDANRANQIGAHPEGRLAVGADGALYGTTQSGGESGRGAIFKVTPQGVATALVQFDSAAGGPYSPQGLIVGPDDAFYGVAFGGVSPNDGGLIFRVTTAGEYSVLHSFPGIDVGPDTNNGGALPVGALFVGSDGLLHGQTAAGGASGQGVIFSISTGGVFTVRRVLDTNVGNGFDNVVGTSGIFAEDPSGNLYGTTAHGSNGAGALFRLAPDNTFAVLHTFVNDPLNTGTHEGEQPNSLHRLANGDLLGTTYGGGPFGGGTLFRYSAGGVFTRLASFGEPLRGQQGLGNRPAGALVSIAGGDFLGVTEFGEPGAGGAIFRYSETNIDPVASDDAVTIIDAKPQLIHALHNDYDEDGGILEVTSFTQPSRGAVTADEFGNFTFVPNANFKQLVGFDSFTYTVSDGQGGSTTATVRLGNPFSVQSGTYQAVVADGRGLVRISFTNTGSLTGQLQIDGRTYKFKGQFTANGFFSTTVAGYPIVVSVDPARFGSPLPAPREGSIRGTMPAGFELSITFNGEEAVAQRQLVFSRQAPAPQVGKYTLLFTPAAGAPVDTPPGTGYATLTLSGNGKVKLVGKLSDGTALSAGTALAGGATPDAPICPLFAVLKYKAKGSLGLPALVFADVAGVSDCAGTATWRKPEQTRGPLYQDGFELTLDVIGSRYQFIASQAPLAVAAGADNISLKLDGGGIAAIDRLATLTAPKSIVVSDSGAEALALSVNPKTGLLSGSFLNTDTQKRVKFSGLLFQKSPQGGGFFLGTAEAGRFHLEPSGP